MPTERRPETPIPVSWVSVDDLLRCRPELAAQIDTLSEADMDRIAKKVGDALQETYWLALGIVLDEFLTG